MRWGINGYVFQNEIVQDETEKIYENSLCTYSWWDDITDSIFKLYGVSNEQNKILF